MKHKKIGDLVRNIHTGELHIITSAMECRYYEVDNQWLIPEEHLDDTEIYWCYFPFCCTCQDGWYDEYDIKSLGIYQSTPKEVSNESR